MKVHRYNRQSNGRSGCRIQLCPDTAQPKIALCQTEATLNLNSVNYVLVHCLDISGRIFLRPTECRP